MYMLNMLTLDILLLDTCHLHAHTWHMSVSLNNWCVIPWHSTCYYLTPAPVMLSLITYTPLWHNLWLVTWLIWPSCHAIICHLPDITLLLCYHLTPGMIFLTLIIITITGIMTWHLDYILIHYSTNCTPDTPYIPDIPSLFLLIPEIW